MTTNREQFEALKKMEAKGRIKSFDPTLYIDGKLETLKGKDALEVLGKMSDEDLDRDWLQGDVERADTPEPVLDKTADAPGPEDNPVGPGGGHAVELEPKDVVELDVGDLVKGPASEAVEEAAGGTNVAESAARGNVVQGPSVVATPETDTATEGEPEVGDDAEAEKAAPGSSS